MIRVGLVDDHALFRKSLANLIDTFENVKVVLEASNGNELFEKLPKTNLDILLLDIQMPGMDGYETCEILNKKHPEIKILIVSQLTSNESVNKIIELGAHGYFTKNADPENLEYAINATYEKGFYFGVELSSLLKDAFQYEKIKTTTDATITVSFTNREIEIIKMAGKELSSIEIANQLGINARTVETHRKRIMEKVGSKNFIGVILYALKHEFISINHF
jgi:two-component system, NarL family, response regulator DegU